MNVFLCAYLGRWTNDPALSVYFICLPVYDGHNLLFEFSDVSRSWQDIPGHPVYSSMKPRTWLRCSLGGTVPSFLFSTLSWTQPILCAMQDEQFLNWKSSIKPISIEHTLLLFSPYIVEGQRKINKSTFGWKSLSDSGRSCGYNAKKALIAINYEVMRGRIYQWVKSLLK